MKIAITGGIGSGKSHACELFAKNGFQIISMDEISKHILDVGTNAYHKTIELFSENILHEDGTINRAILKDTIFADNEKKLALENIVHPEVRLEEEKLRKKLANKHPKKPIITESALLIETGYYKLYDILIAVYASRETRLERVLSRDNMSKELALRIMDTQVHEGEYINYAGIIINNDSDLANLQAEVNRVSEVIKQLIYTSIHD